MVYSGKLTFAENIPHLLPQMKTSYILLLTAFLWAAALTPASAAITVFNATWSGASFGNAAVATGQITIDSATPFNINGFDDLVLTDGQLVTALSVTISGASSGNGTFGIADFGMVVFRLSSANLGAELVGSGGLLDFNLFGNAASAPLGTNVNTLTSSGGSGSQMLLTSLTAAPEPTRMLLAALGGMGLLLRRRRSC